MADSTEEDGCKATVKWVASGTTTEFVTTEVGQGVRSMVPSFTSVQLPTRTVV